MGSGNNDKAIYRALQESLLDDSEEQAQFAIIEAQFNILEEDRIRRRKVINRDRVSGHARLVEDYFSEQAIHSGDFRRRFRMPHSLFIRIVNAVENSTPYFQQRTDASGRLGFTALQKCTAAIRQLAYGAPADHYDEYLRMSEQTANISLVQFCRAVRRVFGPEYLRKPTPADIKRVTALHEEKHGFPGMLGSLDCMHCEWKNCPVAWHGAYTRGDQGVPTIMLEAVASQDLWIWHAFFGLSGSRNDINVLNESPLFNDVLEERAPTFNFMVNGTTYTKGYYLTDGIYPEWAVFVKSFQCPSDEKRKKFKQRQEAARKDIERAFGVLQSRWAIIKGPARGWYKEDLNEIMLSCIILHNMIIEEEGEDVVNWNDTDEQPLVQPFEGPPQDFQRYLQIRTELQDKEMHHQLRHDLIEHIWNNPHFQE